ncbi:hypothetical protein FGE12_20395 [Aggregicoccus sp. 17bor-14]|uniref:hypothetical protein n=1 Tax=Myxococcaceae TaxID=31 RepID=UPI00129C8F48|nr:MULTISPECIES: hypothetical protein [Myxococcaceae]MBF5044770.1 hypothetical protein [Simulacricoccus sp. 17bor-14]MRI90514.1 hypothetical protein [Aggregicoccus sp. 17bor-14]
MGRALPLCTVSLLVLATAASATTAVRLSDEQLVEQSRQIVIGRAVESKSAWVDRALVTLVTVEVSETLKGAPARRLTVALPGGVDANRKFPISMSYPGAPRIGTQEEVFLFLTGPQPTIAQAHTVVGFSQGKYSVVQSAGGEKLVSRDLRGVNLRPASPSARALGPVTDSSMADGGAVPLALFKARIQSLISAGKGR